jgi:hypothetical protein
VCPAFKQNKKRLGEQGVFFELFFIGALEATGTDLNAPAINDFAL